jgi:hypothetical protein
MVGVSESEPSTTLSTVEDQDLGRTYSLPTPLSKSIDIERSGTPTGVPLSFTKTAAGSPGTCKGVVLEKVLGQSIGYISLDVR